MKSSCWAIISVFLCVLLQGCAESKAVCPPGYEKMGVVIRNAVRDAGFSASKRGFGSTNVFWNALLLEKLTGHSATIYLGDIIFYENYTNFMHDKKIWLKWLEDHPCKVSDQEVERLIKEMNESTDFIQGEYDPS